VPEFPMFDLPQKLPGLQRSASLFHQPKGSVANFGIDLKFFRDTYKKLVIANPFVS
jgi:hypothetical protein